MKKFSKKGALLFAGVMAVCAFALPAMSSAATWSVVGSEHTFHSANIGFTATNPALGGITSSCAESTFTVDVRSAAALTVTSASFRRCTANGPGIGHCLVTTTATPNPVPDWTVTGVTTSNVQIHNLVVNTTFETTPTAPGACVNVNGASLTITGTLTGGRWSEPTHSVTFTDAEGLVSHGGGVNNLPVTVRGTLRDTQQTLMLT
jgi:hypothetical protein